MNFKTFLLAVAVLILLSVAGRNAALAQERPSWSGSISYPNGTFIQTGIGTVPSSELGIRVPTSMTVGTPSQGVFRRILKLSDHRAIIYEIAVQRLDEGKRFEVALRSWTPTAEEARELDIDPARVERDFLSHYTTPLTISDGDMLALDVLVNPRTKVKLVDYFRISSRPPIREPQTEDWPAKARLLQIGDVEFLLQNFDLRLNDEVIHHGEGGVSGRFVWLDIPKTGRFIFSLIPISEADGFYRSGYITRQQIIFSDGADKYEISSANPIIPASGVFHLWVRLDRTFTFPTTNLFSGKDFTRGAADYLPLMSSKE